MHRIIVLAVLAISGTWQANVVQAQTSPELDRYLIAGDIRVFYTLEGTSSVPADDRDGSGVPDRVEDIARQMYVARHLFHEVLQFPDPLKSERYRQVTCIQVSLRHRETGNGTAFDEPATARRIAEGKGGEKALNISIGNHVDPFQNITPAHEYFHLVQYGATYFKNGWFLEGNARWAEHAVAAEGLGKVEYPASGPWPQDPARLKQLFAASYDAETILWNPIAKRTDPRGTLPNMPALRALAAMRYSNGEPVLRDMNLTGAPLMREILLELGKQDDIAFTQRKYESWSEENQRSAANTPYVYQAIMDVLRRHTPGVGPYPVP